MTLCFELQQSHEMDYVLCDEVNTRYLTNTYFAWKRSDVGCLYQIDLEKVILQALHVSLQKITIVTYKTTYMYTSYDYFIC